MRSVFFLLTKNRAHVFHPFLTPRCAENAGKEMRFQAVKLPDTLVNSSDLADIHIAFHDCIPYYAAFRCELKGGNNQRAADFLKIYKDYRDEIKGVLEKTAEQLMAFHFPGAVEEPRTLQ